MNPFFVWYPDGGIPRADAARVTAVDAAHAAQIWACREDARSADPLFADGGSCIVHVCRCRDGSPVERYEVTGALMLQYHANKLI